MILDNCRAKTVEAKVHSQPNSSATYVDSTVNQSQNVGQQTRSVTTATKKATSSYVSKQAHAESGSRWQNL
jgi:hypothetical protein